MTTQELLNQAVTHHQSGRLAEAEALYRQVLAQQPNQPDALHLLGLIALKANQPVAAVDLIGRAAAVHPSPDYLKNLGDALCEARRLDDAAAVYRRAIALRPDYPEALNNLANTLNHLRRAGEAVPLCRRAVELRPDYFHAWNNLGNAYQQLDDLEAAFDAYQRAAAINPGNAEVHHNLASIHKQLGRLDEAIEAYDRSLTLRSDSITHSSKVMLLLVHPGYDAAAIHRETLRWNELYAAPLAKFIRRHDNDRAPGRKLRIGYVSPDFCKHVLADNVLPLFRSHDRSMFSVYCYGNVARPDHVTEEFRALSDGYCDIRGVDDATASEMIRANRIDILVDLNLHMNGNRLTLFARKPAPIQIAFAGYPGSTGVKAIDYRLTDPYLDPPGMFDEFYSERSIRLAHSFWCFVPHAEAPPVGLLPAIQNGYLTFGCLNTFSKINDHCLQLWAAVMQRVDRSKLLLMVPQGSARQRLIVRLNALGIATDRVLFSQRQALRGYLELYHRIDIALDTVPYNAHTTSLDGLWMGVPPVTLVGRTVVGRAGVSQLTNLGLPELIAATDEQFVAIAAALAGDLPRLVELRRTMRTRMEASPVMDAVSFVRNIEDAYREIWREWTK